MKLTKCEKNLHYYDAERYAACPHCAKAEGNVVAAIVPSPAAPPPAASDLPAAKEKHSIFSRKKKPAGEVPHTNSLWALEADAAVSDLSEEGMPEEEAAEAGLAAEGPAPSLQTVVNQVVAQSTAAQDMKTVAFYHNAAGSEPVVGWLVCVKGAYLGEGFPLKAGRNNIGRAMDNDVPLAQEMSISRKCHAVLTFDPKKCSFFVQPGESSGLTYLNEELVMTFRPLKAYDKIQLGEAELLFAPFCGDAFAWEDYIK